MGHPAVWVYGLLLAAVLVAVIGGCSPATQPEEDALYVAAAASLARALPEIASAFEAETGTRVVLVFGSSGQLAEQIANGAPYDVFLSADEEHVDALIARGHLDPATRRVYAVGLLALVASSRWAATVHALADLQRPEITQVAIANPEHAPYGRAAQEALERSGLWPAIRPKIVLAENVRQALQFVQTDNAAAGLVARSLLPAENVVAYPLPTDLYTPVRHAAAITVRARHRADAERFLEFLLSPSGQRILEKHGFAAAAQR